MAQATPLCVGLDVHKDSNVREGKLGVERPRADLAHRGINLSA